MHVHAESAANANVVAEKSIELLPTFHLDYRQHGNNIDAQVIGRHIGDLYAYELKFTVDPNMVELKESESNIHGVTINPVQTGDRLYYGSTLKGRTKPLRGTVPLASFKFKAKRATVDEVIGLDSITIVSGDLSAKEFLYSDTK